MRLRTLLGDHPGTAALKNGSIRSDLVEFDFVPYSPTNKGFKPMVREAAFDVSEMAIVTYLMAKSFEKPMVLLPDVVLARFQHGHALYNAKAAKLTPSDLNGKRVGIRSFTTTTGAWLRGILANDYGADVGTVQWVTFEDGHVGEAKDPPGVIRAAGDMTQMLIAGELDAAIYGADMPKDDRLKSVIDNPEAAAREWYARHKMVPVNHMVVVTDELAKSNPDAVAELCRLLEAGRTAARQSGPIDVTPFGKEANRPCLDLLLSYARQQGLVSSQLTVESLF